jgi:hypothetical protein
LVYPGAKAEAGPRAVEAVRNQILKGLALEMWDDVIATCKQSVTFGTGSVLVRALTGTVNFLQIDQNSKIVLQMSSGRFTLATINCEGLLWRRLSKVLSPYRLIAATRRFFWRSI